MEVKDTVKWNEEEEGQEDGVPITFVWQLISHYRGGGFNQEKIFR